MKDREFDPVGIEEVAGPTRIHVMEVGLDQSDPRLAHRHCCDRDLGFEDLRSDGCLLDDIAKLSCRRRPGHYQEAP